jgi:transketolase
MAAAEKHLAAVYNRDAHAVIDHHTFVLCGDGDLMEGISHETASLAGTLGLGKLIVLYDDNLISLDGPTELSYTEDVTLRFEAYHWQVLSVADGNDLVAIEDAIKAGMADTTRPTLIRVRTVIGYGSPKAGTKAAHGEALGVEAVRRPRRTWVGRRTRRSTCRRRRARTGRRPSPGARSCMRSGTRTSRSIRGRIRSRRRSLSGW